MARLMLLVVAVLAAAALAFGACGGDDEEQSTEAPPPAQPAEQPVPGPEAEGPEEGEAGDDRDTGSAVEQGEVTGAASVEEALIGVLESGDPQFACVEFVTPAYVQAAFGDEAGCRAAQPETATRLLGVPEVSVSGDTARATVHARGGPYGGEKLTIELVRGEGGWQVDALRSDIPPGP